MQDYFPENAAWRLRFHSEKPQPPLPAACQSCLLSCYLSGQVDSCSSWGCLRVRVYSVSRKSKTIINMSLLGSACLPAQALSHLSVTFGKSVSFSFGLGLLQVGLVVRLSSFDFGGN